LKNDIEIVTAPLINNGMSIDYASNAIMW
jgi:hypothetical protein